MNNFIVYIPDVYIQKRRGASLMLVPRSKGLRIAQIV